MGSEEFERAIFYSSGLDGCVAGRICDGTGQPSVRSSQVEANLKRFPIRLLHFGNPYSVYIDTTALFPTHDAESGGCQYNCPGKDPGKDPATHANRRLRESRHAS
jgi:hypothetical protein